MAYLKWKPIKYHLNKAIDYVKNDLKTENGELVSSYLCSLNSKEAMLDFLQDNKMNLKSNIKAHHLIMSFSPEDKITPQKAHDLGIELCKKFLKGDRRYIISTHIDREHIHNHIIFNSCSIKKYAKKFDNSIKNLYKVRNIADKICERENLIVIKKNYKNHNKSYFEYLASIQNLSWKQSLKLHLNDCLEFCENLEQLNQELNKRGWKVERLKENYVFTNLKNNKKVKSLKLGKFYKVKNIEKKFLENQKCKKISIQEIKDQNKNKILNKYIVENNLIQMGNVVEFLKEKNLLAKDYIRLYVEKEKELEMIEKEYNNLILRKEDINEIVLNKFDSSKYKERKEIDKKLFELEQKEKLLQKELLEEKIIKDNILKMYKLEKYYNNKKQTKKDTDLTL